MNNLYTVFFILSGLVFSPTVVSAVYKCTDNDGILGFSDTPCAENSTTVSVTQKETNHRSQAKGWVADADTKITFTDAAAWWEQKKNRLVILLTIVPLTIEERSEIQQGALFFLDKHKEKGYAKVKLNFKGDPIHSDSITHVNAVFYGLNKDTGSSWSSSYGKNYVKENISLYQLSSANKYQVIYLRTKKISETLSWDFQVRQPVY